MDQIKQEFLKKMSKLIVVGIWVLSLLISHSFYFHGFTFQLVTNPVDKKYMFFLCNGLLVLLAKYSGLITSSKPLEGSGWSKTDKTFDSGDLGSYDAILDLEYDSVPRTEPFLAVEVNETEEDSTTASLHLEDGDANGEEKEEEEYDDDGDDDNDNGDDNDDEALADNGKQEEECDLRGGVKEDEDDNVGVVTEEDMNKKFEEFIRKMKEELRIEAKQHLIAV